MLCATPRLHRTRRARLTLSRSRHWVRGHRSIPKNRFQFREHAFGLALFFWSSVLLPVPQLPYSSKRSYGSAGSGSSLSLLASGFWVFIGYARCADAVDIHESCMHTNASNKALQPTATRCASSFFMTKTEIFFRFAQRECRRRRAAASRRCTGILYEAESASPHARKWRTRASDLRVIR